MKSIDTMALTGRDSAEYGVSMTRYALFEAVHSLWRLRKASGWTFAELDDSIGRPRGWSSRKLRDPAGLTIETLGELIRALEGDLEVRVLPIETPYAETGHPDRPS